LCIFIIGVRAVSEISSGAEIVHQYSVISVLFWGMCLLNVV